MDLFRKLMTGGDGQQAVIALDLDAQIVRAQKEKQALEALVTSAQAHLVQIPRVNASLEETERRAAAIVNASPVEPPARTSSRTSAGKRRRSKCASSSWKSA